MRFMNEFDLHFARQRFGRGDTPNRLALVMVVDNLREWTDDHSDGWAYWPKPVRAAKSAIEFIDGLNTADARPDITDIEVQTAVRPIKAFLTRQKVSAEDRERILRAVTS